MLRTHPTSSRIMSQPAPRLGVFPGLGNGKFGSPSSFALSPPYFLNEAVAPLKRGELPSLMISDDLPTLELLVNTTKKP